MSFQFNPHDGYIRVPVRFIRDGIVHRLVLVLDTGSTHTAISRSALEYLGFSVRDESHPRSIITGSGVITAPTVFIPCMEAEGIRRENFPVVAFDFPKQSGITGVLGLDFLRGRKVTLDFRQGLLDIE